MWGKKGDYDQFVASKQATKQEENKPQEQTKEENTKQEPAKQENTKQEPAKQENKKQEQTKPQTTAKETKKDTNTAVKTDNKKQGEKLPNTASNGVTMMLASLGLAAIGSVLMFRRKKTNA